MTINKDANDDTNKSLLMNLFQGISDIIFGNYGNADVEADVNCNCNRDDGIIHFCCCCCCCFGGGSGHLIDESEIIL